MTIRPASTSHPLAAHFDWVAQGGRPSRADVDQLVDRCVGDTSGITASAFRDELGRAHREVLGAHDEGSSGTARELAHAYAAQLADALGELPSYDRDAGRSIAEIVASIPRR